MDIPTMCAPMQRFLPLAGGRVKERLQFSEVPSGRYCAATHGKYLYEVRQPLGSAWMARISSLGTGIEIHSRIFGARQLAEAKRWLQARANVIGSGQ